MNRTKFCYGKACVEAEGSNANILLAIGLLAIVGVSIYAISKS